MSDNKQEDYGFYWNPEEKKLIINGEEHTHVSKATIKLLPDEVAKVEIEKIVLKPLVFIEGQVELEVKE